MKYKKGLLIVSSILIFFIYIGGPLLQQKFPIENSIPPVIRFHVRANSDTKEDQELKLQVRDAILNAIGEKFEDSTSLDRSREIILENTGVIAEVSKEVIERWGKDYPVNVALREESFPIRKYGNLVFPQGDYESLIVEIGEAKGANWWCVMFPPICLVDVTHSVAMEKIEDEDSTQAVATDEGEKIDKDADTLDEENPIDKNNNLKQDIKQKIAKEETDKDSPLNEFVVDETRPFKLKSKIFDFFKSLFDEEKPEEVKASSGFLYFVRPLLLIFTSMASSISI